MKGKWCGRRVDDGGLIKSVKMSSHRPSAYPTKLQSNRGSGSSSFSEGPKKKDRWSTTKMPVCQWTSAFVWTLIRLLVPGVEASKNDGGDGKI